VGAAFPVSAGREPVPRGQGGPLSGWRRLDCRELWTAGFADRGLRADKVVYCSLEAETVSLAQKETSALITSIVALTNLASPIRFRRQA
jgi:hypothetical protein